MTPQRDEKVSSLGTRSFCPTEDSNFLSSMHLHTENGDAPAQSGAKSEYFWNIRALLSEV